MYFFSLFGCDGCEVGKEDEVDVEGKVGGEGCLTKSEGELVSLQNLLITFNLPRYTLNNQARIL